MKPTAERILDAAESLFAEKGYSASSLGDLAEEVGIRPPSLYNHFKNKEALYKAVVQRLLLQFKQPFEELIQGPLNTDAVLQWEEKMMRQHIANPNLAKLLAHAALSGEHIGSELVEGLFRPLFERTRPDEDTDIAFLQNKPQLRPWVVMAYVNLVMSYVTFAPLYGELLGEDPLSNKAADMQVAFLQEFSRMFLSADAK